MELVLDAICNEKHGTVKRSVWEVDSLPERMQTISAMLAVRNFAERRYSRLLSHDTILYKIDDVGCVGVLNVIPGRSAEVHFTFWDGRMRGRETLLRSLAEGVLRTHRLVFLHTSIPNNLVAVRAMAGRIGFSLHTATQDAGLYIYYGVSNGD